MKHTLLFLFLGLFITTLSAQQSLDGSATNHFADPPQKIVKNKKLKISIFPNPASDFIQLENGAKVNQILVYNLVGRKMKTFKAVEDEKYDISALPHGMYLVQLVDKSKKIITTQRINKR